MYSRILLALVLLGAVLSSCARKQTPTRTPAPSPTLESTEAGTMQAPAAATAADTGLPDVGPLFEPTPPPQVYVIESGDTLSSIARRFGCTTDDLITTNKLDNPNLLRVGQVLQLPSIDAMTGPDTQMLPNSEFVNGPAYVDFDTAVFSARSGGYLNNYSEYVGGELLGGPEIVDLVAHHFSIGPRLLLALIELETGWVTNPNPGGQAFSHRWLSRAADDLNKGYYDWRGRGVTLLKWTDGTATRYAPTLNAASAGLQYYFSQQVTKGPWEVLVGDGPGSFLETYRKLFGDPAQYAVEPLIPATTTCPVLALPWSVGELWFYTGGPHGAWGDGSAWAAIDAVPDEGYLGCQPASAWATAAASGLVIHSKDGEVLVDLDEDGHVETGWVLFYLHVASEGRVTVGTRVEQGDPIGHPSCEGGFTESSHLHLARKFNGEWIAADGPLPLVLGGWQFHSSDEVYEGTATRGSEERTAWECRDADFCGIVAD